MPDSDYVAEVVAIARNIDGRTPVKLQWTRENDLRSGRFRPMALHGLRAGLDAAGKLVAWDQRIAV
jgi:isoquinoline 1-oxidoreductase beta subunit